MYILYTHLVTIIKVIEILEGIQLVHVYIYMCNRSVVSDRMTVHVFSNF